MTKRVLQRETSIQAILDTALKLFAENGYATTSIRQIAVKAGISLGLLYNYFSSKDELLKAIFLHAKNERKNSFERKEGLTPFDNLEQYVRGTVQDLQESPTYWRLYYSLWSQPTLRQVVGPEISNESQTEITMLTTLLAAAGSHSPSAEAALLAATLKGIAQQFLSQPNYPLQDVVIRYLLQLKNHLKA